MSSLEKKRILLLAPIGQYSEAIKTSLERMGAIIDCFEERPSLTFLVKFFIRYFPNLILRFTQNYFDKIANITKLNNYDVIFMIRAEAVTKKFICNLKGYHKNAKVILYQWDSMSHTRGPVDKLTLFDYVFSFDKRDCEKYSLIFLPLFYKEEYKKLANIKTKRNIDFLFIGTIHSDRYIFIKRIEEYALKKGLKVYLYLYMTSKLGFYKMKFIDKCLENASIDEFNFLQLNKKMVLEAVSNCRIIIDAEHPSQLGLTMRTIESLGAKRKLITTNKDIVNYDFYNPNNILVVDRKNIEIPDSFIKTEYLELDDKIYSKYSLQNWIITIFEKVS